jgi:uronate dehydrogenase
MFATAGNTKPTPTTLVAQHLLLTGAAGGLGQALRPRLAANCTALRLSDIAPSPQPLAPNENWLSADLADCAAVLALCEGIDAIVHLGGVSVERPFDEIVPANIIGVYNLYEAARKQGVKRVVFASSNHVTGFYTQGQTIDASAPPRPDGMYGLSKAFGEDLSRFYFDRHGIETACIRIGSSFPEPKDRRMLASWLSYDDLHRLVVACLSTPVLGHSIVFGMSNNAVSWWDNRLARHVGFVPQDSSDVFRDSVYANTPAPDLNDPAVLYQGGAFVKVPPFESAS